jgi:hypothetical protein
MEAEHVPDGPEYDAAVAADFDAMDAILDSRHADDDRFFVDAAHMIELANGDQQEESYAVTPLKNFLQQRSATRCRPSSLRGTAASRIGDYAPSFA